VSDPLLTALDEAENAVDDARAALFDERLAWQAKLDARPRACLYGCGVPMAGWAEVADFVTKTGLRPQLIRAYPGPNNSLSQVRTAITTYPGAAVVYNVHVASKNPTTAQLDALIKSIEVEATKVPRFVLCPDAEPDRPRPYTAAQFVAAFKRVAYSVQSFAPHVELSMCLTGWDFSSRVGQYDELLPYYETLSLDPYWQKPGAGGVQGSEKNLASALVFCDATGKKLGLAEWGAENGDYKLLSDGLKWIRQHPVEFSCYYIEGGAVPIKGKLTTPEAFAVYAAGAAQP
jgi:hypothetical protein